jgi:type II secretory pathway predicted ATPase ExeA
MYEFFYGFREKPFSILPDPAFLFPSRKHQMALAMLEYGLANQVGFTVITGEIGSGKTTLIRKLLKQIDRHLTVGLVSNTQCDSFEELFCLLSILNIEEKIKLNYIMLLQIFLSMNMD